MFPFFLLVVRRRDNVKYDIIVNDNQIYVYRAIILKRKEHLLGKCHIKRNKKI